MSGKKRSGSSPAVDNGESAVYQLSFYGYTVELKVPTKDENIEIEIQSSGYKTSFLFKFNDFYDKLKDAYESELKYDPFFIGTKKSFLNKQLENLSISNHIRLMKLVEHANKEPAGRTARAFFTAIKKATETAAEKATRFKVESFYLVDEPERKKIGLWSWFRKPQSNVRYEIRTHFNWIVAQLNYETEVLSKITFTNEDFKEKLKDMENIFQSMQKKQKALAAYLKEKKLFFAWWGERADTNLMIKELEKQLKSHEKTQEEVKKEVYMSAVKKYFPTKNPDINNIKLTLSYVLKNAGKEAYLAAIDEYLNSVQLNPDHSENTCEITPTPAVTNGAAAAASSGEVPGVNLYTSPEENDSNIALDEMLTRYKNLPSILHAGNSFAETFAPSFSGFITLLSQCSEDQYASFLERIKEAFSAEDFKRLEADLNELMKKKSREFSVEANAASPRFSRGTSPKPRCPSAGSPVARSPSAGSPVAGFFSSTQREKPEVEAAKLDSKAQLQETFDLFREASP